MFFFFFFFFYSLPQMVVIYLVFARLCLAVNTVARRLGWGSTAAGYCALVTGCCC